MRILGAGDNVVDRYPALGLQFPGGNAVNVPVAARRAGAEAAYLGAIGDDEAGRVILKALADEGVDTSLVRVLPGTTAWVDIDHDAGDRRFGRYDAGVSPFRLRPDELAAAVGFDLVHLCAGGFLEDDVPALATRAPLSFDYKLRRDEAYLAPLLRFTRYAFFSASDLDDAQATRLLERAVAGGAGLAVATRGPLDALALDGGRLVRQAPEPVEALDTLGAGDSFIGRLLVALHAGESLEVGLAAAAHAAAITCRTHGAFGHGSPYQPSAHADGPGTHERPHERLART